MRGFKDHSLHMLVLDEVLELELSNFSRQLKVKSGINKGEKRQNSKETKAHLEAMVLRTKPEANNWLFLTARIAAMGTDAFERRPVTIKKIHAYLIEELNLAENVEEKAAEFVDRVCQVTLETFWTQNSWVGARWTAYFLAKIYPALSRYMISQFLKAVTELLIGVILALFATFGIESFVKGPVVLLTEGVQKLRLDGLLTLLAITHGKLEGLMILTRYRSK